MNEPKDKDKKEIQKRNEDENSKKRKATADDYDEDEVPNPGKMKKDDTKVWKWWDEPDGVNKDGVNTDGVKWHTLTHNGPVFPPPYETVPTDITLYYNKNPVRLSKPAEEVAGFYGHMLDHREYTSKDVFNENFFKDWRKVMTPEERDIIKNFELCNFSDFNAYYKRMSEERKSMTEKQKTEAANEAEKFGFCTIDGHIQKIANYIIEPPGLFKGRGEHPKNGMVKRRVVAEDIIINIGQEAEVPDPPDGHKWKEVKHDNTVSWLASWSENILDSTKYIKLHRSSKLKGKKDYEKYETARKLKDHIDRIRTEYTNDFKSEVMKIKQRAVALYFIDRLALRAGHKKDSSVTADSFGCCSLRVEHLTLHNEKDGKQWVIDLDFLGKDSIRYINSVPVEEQAYENLKDFIDSKDPGDELFDKLNTTFLNKYLTELMEGLTAKVFRTYNASITFQEQLDLRTKEDMSMSEKKLAYNDANRIVAILCNHKRAAPEGLSESMDSLKSKTVEMEEQIERQKKEITDAKSAAHSGHIEKTEFEQKEKKLVTLEEQLKQLNLQAPFKEENKQIALDSSKDNYLDPRISVGWKSSLEYWIKTLVIAEKRRCKSVN